MTTLVRSQPTPARVSDAALLAGFAGLLVACPLLWETTGLQFPECWFLAATGVPCPTCGSTRALLALGHADLPLAFARNPLLATGVVFLLLQPISAVLRVRLNASPRAVAAMVVSLFFANWIYLVVALPR